MGFETRGRRIARWASVVTIGVLSTLAAVPLPAAQADTIAPFGKVFSTQTNGSISITGNSLLTCVQFGSFNCENSKDGSGNGSTGNNNLIMVELDTDGDTSTSNSSSANVTLPTGGKVLFAGLYWSAPTLRGANGSNAPGGAHTLKFKAPGGAYQTLSPDTEHNLTAFADDYSAFKDVTSIVAAGGSGTYFGADIKAATGQDRYAGWSLVVAVSDPAAPLRDLAVFNGYYTLRNEVVDTQISGFLAPPRGPVNAEVGAIVYEGDQHLSGDYFEINGQRQSDGQNPSGNFWRSRITDKGKNRTDRNPNSLNNLGPDAKVIDATGAIPNGATSANIRFGTSGDVYYPTTLTTQIDLFAPTIVGTKSVSNLAGTNPAKVGDTLEYTLNFTNTGDDDAINNVITDELPPNVTYVPGSLRVTAGANQGPQSDTAGNDQGEYDNGNRTIRVRAGTGANGTQGGRLAKNASQTVKFRVTVDTLAAGTTITNDADIAYRAETIAKDFTYTTAPVSIPVGTLADLRISKSASPEPVRAGDTLTYTLTVNNDGPNAALNSRIQDTLPTGVTYVSAVPSQGNCSQSGGTVACSVGDIANGDQVIVTITTKVKPGFTGDGLTNVASVVADTSDPNTANNTASAPSTVQRAADLAITKSTSDTAPVPGTDVTYTLEVTNNGPSNALQTEVTDDLPAGFVSATATTTIGTCTVNETSVGCNLGTLAAGATGTITVTGRLSPSAGTTPLLNTATISSVTPDPVPANNSSDVTVTPVAKEANVSIAKQTVTSPVVPGQPIEYTVTVTNDGPSDATAVQVSDTLPAGISGGSAAPSQGTCNAALVCQLGTIQANSSATITVTGDVDAAETGTLVNSADVSSPDDNTPGNNTASVTDNFAPRADLAITKRATPNPVVDGNPATYTLTVTNNGPSDAQLVEVDDDVPSPLTVTSAVPSTGDCNDTSGNNVNCDLGTVAPGDTVTVTITVDTPPGGGANGVVNTATVSSPTPDPVAGNNSADAALSANAQANVRITKTVTPAVVVAGENLQYVLTVTNDGPSTANGITVTDNLPAGVTRTVGGTSWNTPTSCSVTSQSVTCTRPTLASGASFTVNITGTVNQDTDPGILANTATVSSATPNDPSLSDNTATATNTVRAEADLQLSKSAPATVLAGNVLEYTLNVTNGGPSQARSSVITDNLPAGTTFLPGTSDSDCALQTGSTTTIECTLGDLDDGATRAITVRVRVDPSVPSTTVLTNNAQISSTTPDPTPGNNNGSANTTVNTSADLTVVKSATPTRLVAGKEATYIISVTNNGPSTALNPQVVDTLPSGLSLTEAIPAIGTCTESPTRTVTCDRASLAPGSTWTITLRVFVDPSTTANQVNNVTVDSATPDPTPGDNAFPLDSPVDAAGDLEVIKTALPSPIVPGEQIAYTLTVVNFGPATMADVTITDTLPVGLSESVATSSQGTCTGTPGRNLVCNLGSVLPGATVTINITALLAPDFTAATLLNTATASSSTRDTDPSNDSSDAEVPVTPSADLTIVKRADPSTIVPGSPFDYFLEVTNKGSSTAAATTVTDSVPEGLTVVSATYGPDGTGSACSINDQDVSCSIGAFDTGRILVQIRVRPDANLSDDSVVNTARVSSTTPDPTPGDNTSTISSPVLPTADVVLTKTRTAPVPPAPVVPGGDVTWTISVTNPTGPSAARGVVVRDQLAAGLTDPAVTTSNGSVCTISPGGLIECPVNVVAVGDQVDLTVTATVAPDFTGTLANSATADADTSDPNPSNNTDGTSDTAEAQADIVLTKTRTSGPIVPGTRVSYTVNVTNTGPSTAVGVTVEDSVPTALTGVTATTGTGTCDVIGNDVECGLGDLAPGASVDIIISGDLPADYSQPNLVNAATATSPTDTTPGNNTDTSSGPTTPAADLSIEKARTSGPVIPGQPVTWELTVDNLGPSTAVGGRVSDNLNAALANVTVSATGGAVCNVDASNLVTCDLPDFAPDAPAITVTITGDVPANFTGRLDNTATVSTGPGGTPDPVTTNNQASVDGNANPQADVSIAKSRTSGPITPGAGVTWTLTIDNDGPSSARNITVTDNLNDALTNLTATGPSGVTCDITTNGADTNIVNCTLPNLAPSAQPITITITGDIPADYTGALNNTATVSSPDDTTGSNNTSTSNGTAVPAADLTITKSRTSGPITPGQPVTWTVTTTNNGPSVATNVAITDNVNNALTGLTVTITDGPGTCDPIAPGNNIACTIGDLNPNQSATATITGNLPADYTGDLDNTATVTSPDDTTPNNNQATSTGTATPTADVSIEKARTSGPIVPGTEVTWTLTVSNSGPSTATNVTVADDVIDALTGVTATSTDATCDPIAPSDNAISCAVNDLAPGDTIVITVRGDVPAGFTGNLDNTATVTSPVDNTPDNNTSTVPGTATPAADVTILKQRTSGPVVAGQPVTWTLTATNNGPSVARNVTVQDDVNNALTAVNATITTGPGTCNPVAPGNQITCTLGDLDPATTTTIEVTGNVPAAYTGTLNNTATITSPTDNTPANNTSTSNGDVNSDANVSIIKARTTGPITPGQPVTWTLTIDNAGPSTATNVTVTDDVVDALTNLTATVTTGPGTCDPIGAGNQVTCNLGSIDPTDAPITITITGEIPASYTGDLDNTAIVDSPDDTDAADNISSTNGTATPESDVSITKTRTTGTITPGLPVTWQLTVLNAGPSDAPNVRVTDDVIDALQNVSVSGAPCDPVDPSDNLVSCNLGTLVAGSAPVTITISGDLPAGFTGDATNTARVTSPTDTTPTNNVSTVPGQAQPSADVSISKARTSGPIVPGQPVTWTLTVDNAGPSTAVDVTVTDDVNNALTGLTAGGPGVTCLVNPGNEVTCNLGSLAPSDDPVVITVTGDLPPDFLGDLDNTATVASPTDDTPGNNTSDSNGAAVPVADVSLIKTRTSGQIVPGQAVTWTLAVTNSGPSTARLVTVTDQVNASLTDVVADGAPCSVSDTNLVECAIGDLDPAGVVTITITGNLPADFTGDLDNTATVDSPTDDTPDNNSSDADGTADPLAEVSVVKTRISGTVEAGKPVAWTLVVTNGGPSVARDVTLTDDVNPAVKGITTDIAGGPSGAACTVASDNRVTCVLGDLAPADGPVTITLAGDLDPAFTGSLDNTATVDSSTPDTSPLNNTDLSSGGVQASADLSVTKKARTARPTAGGSVVYDILVKNTGPAVAVNTKLRDELPAGLRAVRATASSGSCTTGRVVTCTLGDLAVGDRVKVVVTATIDTDVSGPVTNVASVTSDTGDQAVSNNTDDAQVTVVAGGSDGGDQGPGSGLPDTGNSPWVGVALWAGLLSLLLGLGLVLAGRRTRET